MAGSLNKVILIGRLGRDPEMRAERDLETARGKHSTRSSW